MTQFTMGAHPRLILNGTIGVQLCCYSWLCVRLLLPVIFSYTGVLFILSFCGFAGKVSHIFTCL